MKLFFLHFYCFYLQSILLHPLPYRTCHCLANKISHFVHRVGVSIIKRFYNFYTYIYPGQITSSSSKEIIIYDSQSVKIQEDRSYLLGITSPKIRLKISMQVCYNKYLHNFLKNFKKCIQENYRTDCLRVQSSQSIFTPKLSS